MLRSDRLSQQSLALLTGMFAVVACTTSQDNSAEASVAIAAARSAFWEAHAQGNSQGLADLFTEDGALWAPGTEAIQGRDAIRAAAERMFAALAVTDFKMESQDLQLHGPIAYELTTFSQILTPKGGQPSPARGRYLIVWKQGAADRWRVHLSMTHFINGGR